MKLGTILFGCLVAAPVWGASRQVQYKDIVLDLRETDRVVVSALRGRIRLVPSAEGKPAILRARKALADKATPADQAEFSSLSFGLRRDGRTLFIEQKSPLNKSAIADWVKPGSPELHFEVAVPAIAVEVLVREGEMQVKGFKGTINSSLISGSVAASGTENLLQVQIQRGQVKVENHKGSLDIDSYGAKVSASAVEGNFSLANFSGVTTLSKLKGSLNFRGHAGPTSISASSGSIDFQNGRGALTIDEFEGPVRGQTELGPVVLNLTGEADVNLESTQGNISIKPPANSGASVRFQTQDGYLVVPEALQLISEAPVKIAAGKLTGPGSTGEITAKSKSGTIRLR